MLREDIILKLEELEKQTKTYKKLLQVWDKSGLEQHTGTAMRFFNARPRTAIVQLLREKGPQTQEQLMKELAGRRYSYWKETRDAQYSDLD